MMFFALKSISIISSRPSTIQSVLIVEAGQFEQWHANDHSQQQNCFAETKPAALSGNSSTNANKHDNNWNVCPWTKPASTAPPASHPVQSQSLSECTPFYSRERTLTPNSQIQYFTDPGIGDYSIQFTATDTVAWADAPAINGTTKCVAEGLCNPQLVFYRKGYNLVIDTWKVHDDNFGGYSD